MAIQTGSVTSMSNLLSTLMTFAATNAGFTIEADITNLTYSSLDMPDGGGNPWTCRRLSRAGSTLNWLFWLNDADDAITEGLTGGDRVLPCMLSYEVPNGSTFSTTFATTNGLTNVPTKESRMTIYKHPASSFSIPYWMYTEGTQVHAVFESFPNVFTHISFGLMTKYGTWTGGEYLSAHYPISRQGGAGNEGNYLFSSSNDIIFQESGLNTTARNHLVKVQSGTDPDDFCPMGATVLSNGQAAEVAFSNSDVSLDPASRNFDKFASKLLLTARNQFNLRNPLLPMHVRARDVNSISTAPGNRNNVYNIIGTFENVRMVNITNLTPKSLVDTDWRVFPLCQKEGGDVTIAPDSRWLGIAYREVP